MTRLESPSSSPLPENADPEAALPPRVAELLETYLAHAQEGLRHGSGRNRLVKRARAFLQQRGVAADHWDRLPLGVLPETAEMEAVLCQAGFLPEEIEASKLLADPRLPGRLVGPIRDTEGRLVSFWAKHPEGQTPKYLIKGPWRDELAVAGLEVALPALENAQGDLLLIGDLLDTVLLQYHGFGPVAALGGPGAQMTSHRWQRLAEHGVAQVTLALTGPNVRDELLTALEAAWMAVASPRIWVVLPERFQEAGTWSEWVHQHGVGVFRQALAAERIHAYRYCALVLLQSYQAGVAWTEATRQAAWEAAHVFYDAHAGGLRTEELDTHFVPCIVEALQIAWEPIETAEPEEVLEEIAEPEPPEELPVVVVSEPKPLRSLALEMADWLALARRRSRGLLVRTLPGFNRAISGLHGQVLVAGATRMVRSALTLQLASEAVRQNPDACLLMVSRRWSSSEILTRLLARRARIAWKRLVRDSERFSEAAEQRLVEAQRDLVDWGRRVVILDRQSDVEPSLPHLVEAWTRLREECEAARGLLLIDDLDAWVSVAGASPSHDRPCELLQELADRTKAEAVLATVSGDPERWSDEVDFTLALQLLGTRTLEPGRRLVLGSLQVTDAQEVAPVARLDLTFQPQSWRFRQGHPEIPVLEEPVELPPARRVRTASDYCTLHQCSVWECFCFD